MPKSAPPTHVTESLVAQAKAGDREAFDRLFTLASDRALLFIRLRLGARLRGRLDSMDVLQEAYVEALKGFERFEYRGDDAFARWLCRLIENRIRGLADHFGAKKRTPPKGELHVSHVIDRVRASQTGPFSALDRGDARERLAQALAELEDAERETVLLRFFQGRTLDEIAEMTGRSPTGVRRLLGKSALKLGRHLQALAPRGSDD